MRVAHVPESVHMPTQSTGVGSSFGTFGELLQGVLPEPDGDFLVTLPIARWSVATFRTDPTSTELLVRPPHKLKALRLLGMIMDGVPSAAGGVLTLESHLPEGKGLASSSADLVATVRAVNNALSMDMAREQIEQLLSRIEPTDGVLHPGIVAYHHRSVRLRAVLGTLPSMAVVGIDEGGMVDTVEFNRIPKPFGHAEQRQYARLLDRLAGAIAGRDLRSVGTVATRSAQLNQRLHPKRMLDSVIEICRDVRGLGVIVAHSGTSIGVLLDVSDPYFPDQVAAAATACSSLAGNVTVYRTLSFGISTSRRKR